MLKGGMSSSKLFGRIGLFFVISAMFLTITAAGANAAGFSFMDSVVEFFGIATTQTTAPVTQTEEPISAPAMEPMFFASQFFAGDGTGLATSKWGPDGGPYTGAFTAGNVANFNVVNGTGTGGSITVGGINATENFTITTAGGTLGGTASAVNPITVSSGKTFDAGSQGWTTGATVGFSLTGPGTLKTAGGTFGGGFVLNSGMLVAGGVNAMGAASSLTINGGTIAANSNRTFTGKYPSGITVAGNFQLGALAASVPLSSDSATLLFDNNIGLGAATRTITIGANGSYTINSIISSATTTTGLTVNNLAGATGSLVLGGTNTYTGPVTLSGGILSVGTIGNGGVAGNLGKASNAATNLVFDGGTLKYSGTTSSTDRNFTINPAKTATIDLSANDLTMSGSSGASTGSFTKLGIGVLTLSGTHSYTGNTTISAGEIALSAGGSIAISPVIEIQGGAFFDPTARTTALTLSSGQAIKASGTTTTGTINTSSINGLTTASDSPLQFTAYNGTNAPLTVALSGTLALQSGNPVTVTVSNGGVALAVGDHKLIAKSGTASVTGTPTSVTVNGDGVCAGCTSSLVLTSGELFLRVAVSTFQLSVTKGGTGAAFGTVTSGDGTISCGSACSAIYSSGTAVTLTASGGTGSVFTGWGGDCSGQPLAGCTVTISQARTVSAAFTVNSYQLDVVRAGNAATLTTVTGNNINCGSFCSATYTHGTQVTLTANTSNGTTFAWSGAGCSGSGTCVVTMDAAKTVTATTTLVKQTLTVTTLGTGSGTVTSAPAGIDCPGTCTAQYDHGTQVTLTATAGSDSTFTGWSGSCGGTASTCVQTMTSAQAPRATFTLKTSQTITFTAPSTLKFGDPDFDLTTVASSSSGLPLSFSVSPPSVCTMSSSGQLHIGAAGSCTVTASQAGDATYLPAPDVQRTFPVGKGSQTLSFSTTPPSSLAFGRTAQLSVSASPGGVAISFAATGGACDVSPTGLVTMTSGSVGSCTVTASTDATSNYEAGSVQCSISPIRDTPMLVFSAPLPPAELEYGRTAQLTVSGTPGGSTLSFTATGGACTVSSTGLVTMTSGSVGTCSLTAFSTQTADYEAGVSEARPMAPRRETPTLVFSSPPSQLAYGKSATLVVTGSPGGSATGFVASGGACAVTPTGLVTMTSGSVGTCTVTASTEQTPDYEAASVECTITPVRDLVTLTFDPPPPSQLAYGKTAMLVVTGSPGGSATAFHASGGACDVTPGGVVTITSGSVGTCSVSASTDQTPDYEAATTGTYVITITRAMPTVTITNAAVLANPTVAGAPLTVDFTITNSGGVPSGIPPSGTLRVMSGGSVLCTYALTGSEDGSCSFTPAVAGTYQLVAHYDGDSNYLLADSSPPVDHVVSPRPATLLVSAPLSFGSMQLDTESAPQTITLTNTGDLDLTITSMAIDGVHPNDFQLKTANPPSSCPGTLSSGQTCQRVVTFQSQWAQSRSGRLSVQTNGGNAQVELSGTGVDSTTPVSSFTSGPAEGSTSGPDVTFTFTSSEPSSTTYTCSLDGALDTPCTSPQSFTALAGGGHTDTIKVMDSLGNAGLAVTRMWTVDTSGPVTTFVTRPPAFTSLTSAQFTFTSSVAPATFECSLDSTGFSSCESPVRLTAMPEGSHTIRVRALDAAGNAEATAKSFTWVVDTTPPTVSILTHPPAVTTATTAEFTFTGADSGSGVAAFECKLDSAQTFTFCTSPLDLSGLALGDHTFTVRAVDKAGNRVASVDSFTWSITPPSSDASLSDLTVSSGSLQPSFSPSVLSYSLSIPPAVSVLSLRPTCGHPSSSVTIEGSPVTCDVDSPAIPISFGTTVLHIRVVAEDGLTEGIYVITITRPAPDLVIPSNMFLAGGTYHNVSFGGCFKATMDGDVIITGAMTVAACQTLDTNGHIVSGDGSFVLGDGGAIYISNPYGLAKLNSPTCPVGQCGAVQTLTRSFSSAADYTYNGATDQIVGEGLPETVHDLVVLSPPGTLADTRLDGYSPQTVTGKIKTVGANGEGKKEYVGHVSLLKRPAVPCTEIDTYHNVEIGAGGKLTLGCDVVVTGDWTMASGGELAGDFAVTFDGVSQTISGDTNFFDLRKLTPGSELLFPPLSRTTVMHDLLVKGDIDGAEIKVGRKGGTQGSHWELCALGTRNIDYVTVSDSDATCSGTPITATHATDNGGNTNWLFNPRELSVQRTGSGSGTVTSSPPGIACGAVCSASFDTGTLVTLTAAPDSSSAFAGWSGACSGTATTCEVTMDAAKTVFANFPHMHALAVHKAGTGGGRITSQPAGIDCGTACSGSFVEGSMVTLTAAPDSSSTLGSWSGDCAGQAPASCTLTMDAAKDVTKTFPRQQHAMAVTRTSGGTVTSSPQGITCGAVCTADFDSGTVVTLTATPDSGASFAGWTGACAGQPENCDVTMDSAKSVGARFTFHLTVSSSGSESGSGLVTSQPPGISCRGTGGPDDDCDGDFDGGSEITLHATPDAGSAFVGWEGDCSGTGDCVVSAIVPRVILKSFRSLSSDASLSSLTVSSGSLSPSFSPSVLSYSMTVPHATSSISVRPTCASGTCSSIIVEGTPVSSGVDSPPVSLSVRENQVHVRVTAEDGTTQAVYTITITRNMAAPVGCKFFETDNIPVGATAVLHIQVGCGGPVTDDGGDLTGISFTDQLPPGMTIADESTDRTGVCGTGTIHVQDNSIYMFGGKINRAAGELCDSAFTVTAAANGGNMNTIDNLAAPGADGGAHFESTLHVLDQYLLSVSSSGAGSGTVTSSPQGISCGASCSAGFAFGSSVSLSAVPNSVSTFAGWTGACAGQSAVCTLTMDAVKTASVIWHVDASPPTVSISSTTPNPTNGAMTVAWSADEGGSFSVRLDGTDCDDSDPKISGVYNSGTIRDSVVDTSSFTQGAHTIRVCVTDAAGNTGSDSRAFIVDRDPPVVTFESVSPNPTTSSTTVTFGADSDGDYSVHVGGETCDDGNAIASGVLVLHKGVTTIPPTAMLRGTNTIRVCVTDAAGNTGSVATTVLVESCVAPENPASGEVDMPVECRFLGGEITVPWVPANPTILHKASFALDSPTDVVHSQGGTLGGGRDAWHGTFRLVQPPSTGVVRSIDIPVQVCMDRGPRQTTSLDSSFDMAMCGMQGEITGDPDFDLLRITAGSGFGMPSPGHTTLTRMSGTPNFAVDSFVDVSYQLEFTGKQGGPYSGMFGSTTGTIRMSAVSGPAPQVECSAADNGAGSTNIPAPCAYQGWPAIVAGREDARLESKFTMDAFTNPVHSPGGSLGGERDTSTCAFTFTVDGTGPLAAYMRTITMPNGECVMDTAPHSAGSPVQSFDTDMFRLIGQLPPGDPDFDLLRITAGSSFGLPSPGHTTLTRVCDGQGGCTWAVDSFFDVFYLVDFVGRPGGRLDGMSGSTTGTIRMQQGMPTFADGEITTFTATPNPVAVGDAISFRHVIRNNGNSADTFSVTGELPVGLTFDGSSDGTCSVSTNGRTCTCTPGYMPSGSSKSTMFTAHADASLAGTDVSVTMALSGQLPDPDPTNNSKTATTHVAAAATPTATNTSTPTSTATSTSTATATSTVTATSTATPSVDFCQQPVTAGQAALCGTGSDATSSDTTVTQVSIPAGAAPSSFTLSITETNNPIPPSGFTSCGQLVHIDADSVTLTSPATVLFQLDASQCSGRVLEAMQILRNGVPVPDCNGANDPCVCGRSVEADGDRLFCGKTSHFSDWMIAYNDSTIAGTVTYGNPVTGPNPRAVPGVVLGGAGSPAVTDTSSGTGTYLLDGFGLGSYTITPSKSGGVNGAITSFDSAKIAQYVTGNAGLSTAQASVADVSGTGGVSSFDAALIARYAAALGAPTGNSGTWLFSPVSNTHASVSANITGENYGALLMGDVSGNWGAPSPFRPGIGGGPERQAIVEAPNLVTPADNGVIVPVSVAGAAGKGIISYEFDVNYDASVIQPQANPVDIAGTVSRGLSVVTNSETAGLLRVVVYGPTAIDASGVLLNLRFTAVGAPGSVSPIAFDRFVLNEGDPRVVVANGQVELSAAAPNQAELNGRLLTTFGKGLANSRVTLTDTAGQSRSIRSNEAGSYRFGGLTVGQTYTLRVESRGSTFAPMTISVTGQAVTADMIAEQ